MNDEVKDTWVEQIIQSFPDYAVQLGADLHLAINTPILDEIDIHACALAAAIAAGNGALAYEIGMNGPLRRTNEREIAFKAASVMGKNNVWNNFTKIAGGDTLLSSDEDNRQKFEMYALAASIVGNDSISIKSYCTSLLGLGLSLEQLQHIGKLAAIVAAIGKTTP